MAITPSPVPKTVPKPIRRKVKKPLENVPAALSQSNEINRLNSLFPAAKPSGNLPPNITISESKTNAPRSLHAAPTPFETAIGRQPIGGGRGGGGFILDKPYHIKLQSFVVGLDLSSPQDGGGSARTVSPGPADPPSMPAAHLTEEAYFEKFSQLLEQEISGSLLTVSAL